jgi:hypothetical protein
MKKFFVLSILFLILSLALSSCSLFPRTPTISDVMPRETDVPGWSVERQYRTRSSRKMSQFSPLYGEHDPAELAITEYAHVSDKSKTVRVEMIRLGSSLDSFGFFSRERGLGRAFQIIDDNTYATPGCLYARIGMYYIKISYENLGDQDRSIIDQFLGVVRENLKSLAGDNSLPDQLFLFSKNHSTRDIVYYKRKMDAVPGLKNATVVRRVLAGKKYDLVCAVYSTAFDAEQEYLGILKAGGGDYVLTKVGKLQPAIRIISDTEYLFICQYKQWIFGVLDADTMNEGNMIIGYLLTEIKNKAEKKTSAGDGS